jgi:cellulose synthase/poly-beta-1,6-N-acetylglucosamine synthase-like glycosyltransferase
MTRVSVGVMAYNEEANVGRLLERLVSEYPPESEIIEIVVVSSGSTDSTDEIVGKWEEKDERVRLIRETVRRGKASAINLFLAEAEGEVLIMESADTLPEQGTIEKLIAPFSDPEIGMTGGRPIPVNDPRSFMGFLCHLLWRLHHRLALVEPKLGEMVAFRNVVNAIPAETAVDEASIEAIVTSKGYRLAYIPDATVWNKGPENLRDFLKQRRRIYAGHLWLQDAQDYTVSTKGVGRILKLFFSELRPHPKEYLWGVTAIFLEAVGRMLGEYDYKVRKINPYRWQVARSTKKL